MGDVSAPAPAAPGAPANRGRTARWLALLRRHAPLAAVAIAVVALGVFLARTSSGGMPFDPSSPEADGTKALALILDRVGADVTVLDRAHNLDVDTLLVLVDNLDRASHDEIERFVRAGGTALVADYGGRLARDLRPAGSASTGLIEPTLERGCDVPALEGIDRVRPGASPLFVIPHGATGCFGREETAWLIIREEGGGVWITTGGPTFLINSTIGEVDNAPLAAALLAPTPGTRVGILRPSFAVADAGAGAEPTSLGDLVPAAVTVAVLQLLVAFGIVVLWRMRRLGKPVREQQAVRLAGSELVLAVGNLFQRTGARTRATQLLRNDFRRSVAHRLGVPVDLPAEDLADLAAGRTGADREEVLAALAGPVPSSDAELVSLAQRLETLRSESVLSASAPSGARRAPTS